MQIWTTRIRIARSSLVTFTTGFFLNAILYHRKLYPENTFQIVPRHGLDLPVAANPRLRDYMRNILNQISDWLTKETLLRVVLVLINERGQAIERWSMNAVYLDFNPDCQESTMVNSFREIFSQVADSKRVLPPVQSRYRFDVLVITEDTVEAPTQWEETQMQALGTCKRYALHPFKTPHLELEVEVAYLAL